MNVVLLSDESAVAKEHLMKKDEPSTLYLMAQNPHNWCQHQMVQINEIGYSEL